MKIQFLSDLHMEVWKNSLPKITFDEDTNVIIFAGDISNDENQALSYMKKLVDQGYVVLYTPGNHEYYKHEYNEQYQAIKKACEDAGVVFLEMEYIDIEGVRFIGTTLWTDYNAHKTDDKNLSKMLASQGLNDHYVIRFNDRRLLPNDCDDFNDMAKEFLRHNVDPDQPTIIVSHHAPVLHAVAPKFKGDRLNPAFVNDWSEFVSDLKAEAWIFGHTHHDIDVVIGDTRVVSRQLGYPGERKDFAISFKPETIEL